MGNTDSAPLPIAGSGADVPWDADVEATISARFQRAFADFSETFCEVGEDRFVPARFQRFAVAAVEDDAGLRASVDGQRVAGGDGQSVAGADANRRGDLQNASPMAGSISVPVVCLTKSDSSAGLGAGGVMGSR